MLSSSGSVRHGSRRSTPPARRRREPAGRVASRMPARRSGGSTWLSARVRARDRLARGLPPLSVVLSAVCARVRACVFSTDVGGPERERAGPGCYPEVRTAGRCRGGSQALRWQGIKCPESPAWRMGRFWDALGRPSQQRSQYHPEAPPEVPECAGGLVTPLGSPENVAGSRWGAH